MNTEELKEYLKNNLKINVIEHCYPYEDITKELVIELEDEEIARCTI